MLLWVPRWTRAPTHRRPLSPLAVFQAGATSRRIEGDESYRAGFRRIGQAQTGYRPGLPTSLGSLLPMSDVIRSASHTYHCPGRDRQPHPVAALPRRCGSRAGRPPGINSRMGFYHHPSTASTGPSTVRAHCASAPASCDSDAVLVRRKRLMRRDRRAAVRPRPGLWGQPRSGALHWRQERQAARHPAAFQTARWPLGRSRSGEGVRRRTPTGTTT